MLVNLRFVLLAHLEDGVQVTVDAVLCHILVKSVEGVERHFPLVERQKLARTRVVAQVWCLHGEGALVVGHRLYELSYCMMARPCRCARARLSSL